VRIAIHQPYYLPWLGYFEKIKKSDIFVFLDDAQYEKNNFYNRNLIKGPNGKIWLTVPVHYKFQISLKDIKVDNSKNWQKKHYNAIVSNYAKAPHFEIHKAFLENVYLNKKWDFLIDLNLVTLKYLLDFLKLKTPLKFSSDMNIQATGTQRLIDICKALKADTYYSGSSGKKYMDLSLFKKDGIEVEYQNYECKEYKQRFGSDFMGNLSVIDLVMNQGRQALGLI